MRPSAHSQRGAALVISLLMLLIVILLGVAAVRATRTELRLSLNSESQMAAIQAAQSMVAYVNSPELLPVNENQNYTACVPLNVVVEDFTCTTAGIDLGAATPALRDYGYAVIRRQEPLFVEVNVMREIEASAKNYDFARFTVTGGLNRSGDGMGAAEITEGLLRLHVKPLGTGYE